MKKFKTSFVLSFCKHLKLDVVFMQCFLFLKLNIYMCVKKGNVETLPVCLTPYFGTN